ncbi:hypothetical protein ACLMJK_001244 [Lecanora helva]
MADQYQVLEELGSGSFGVVYKAIEIATGEVVAIKHIDLESSDDDIQDIQQEISVLSTCDSPFVTQYKASFLRGHKLWIVMEYLGGGSCLDLLKSGPFHESYIAVICRELLLGLDYLHKEGKIHRDIKAANVLLAHSGKVKLADFGVAAQLTNIKSQRNTFVGTPFWMAPEVIQQAGYDFKADIWSLGITAMELVNGEPPNASTHPMKVLFLIPKAPAPRLEGGGYSREFKDFVAACLVKDPDRRPTARELLQHRFIKSAGRIESLKELIQRREMTEDGRGRASHPKFYEETLTPMSASEAKDDWIFDTVKAATIMTPQRDGTSTQKRRKTSNPHDKVYESPEAILDRLTLEEKGTTGTAPSSTVRRATMKRRSSPISDASPVKRRSSSQRVPLAPSTSFGNSPSTTKHFRRVSDNRMDDSSPTSIPETDENQENMAQNVTTEALLGRRAYSKIIDQAFQEVHAQTASQNKRKVISQVALAWDALDKDDPEGEYHLLKLIIEKVQDDPKLSKLLPLSQPATPQKPKLVLAQNNPHLKSHRRRQSSVLSAEDSWIEKETQLPGRTTPGMEHTEQLAEVLYSKWAEGLKNRWPNL